MTTAEHVVNEITRTNDWLRHQKTLHAEAHRDAGVVARRIRETAQLSLRAVAAEMEITYPFLADLELGRRTWTKATVQSWKAAIEKLQQNPKLSGADAS